MIAPAPVLEPAVSWRNATESTARVLVRELTPPKRMLISEWAELYRMLPEESAEPGPWRNDRTPYLVGLMDACLEHGVEQIVFQKCAQIGGSECLNNIIGYFLHQDPSPVMLIQSGEKEAKSYSKERIAKMIDATPVLSSRLVEDNLLVKDFTGGAHLAIAGANAPAGLRSRARRILAADEVDSYPPSAGAEGDPVGLAEARTRTYWNRLIILNSTPTLEGLSRIEAARDDCDEIRIYLVPCPHCAHLQHLRFPQLQWDKDPDGEHLPDSAEYCCEACGAMIPERRKSWMLANGKWVSHRKAEEGEQDEKAAVGGTRWIPCDPHPRPKSIAFAGFTALYSPWMKWQEIVRAFLKSKDNPVRLQVFVNTILGEVFREAGYQLDAHPLMKRQEVYPAEPVPEGVLLLTAGVDVQADRLEVEIVGWGENYENWSLEFMRILGDPSLEGGVWNTLDHVLSRSWMHPHGVKLNIFATAIDSGYLTQTVYKYCKERWQGNVWAVKGVAGHGRPIWDKPTNKNKYKTPVFPVGVDTGKTALYSHLRVQRPNDWSGDPIPGFCHFPSRDPYDEEYFRQLTAEQAVVRQDKRGVLRRIWIRRPGRRAEALDCRVYALAAHEGAYLQGIRLEEIRKAIERGGQTGSKRRVRRRGESPG